MMRSAWKRSTFGRPAVITPSSSRRGGGILWQTGYRALADDEIRWPLKMVPVGVPVPPATEPLGMLTTNDGRASGPRLD